MSDLTGLPECGFTCLVDYLGSSSCAATNQTCLCEDSIFNHVVTNCVEVNCTVIDQLTIQNITSNICGWGQPNQDNTLVAVNVIFFSLQTLFYLLRMLSRALRVERWGHDDTTLTIAYILVVGFLGVSIVGQRNGLGRNIWEVFPAQITVFLKVVFVFEVLYSASMALVKMSICFLYLRMFPGEDFCRIVKYTQIINVLALVGFVITDLAQCQPINFFWTGWDGTHEGWCFNSNALIWAQAAANIVLDFWLLALPASQLWILKSGSSRKKFGVHVMFALGIFQTIVSLVRLQTLVNFNKTTNPTMNFFGVGIWSASESTLGIMIVCLPAAYQMFKHRHQQHASRSQTPSSGLNTANGDGSGCGSCQQHHHHHLNENLAKSKAFDGGGGGGKMTRRRHSISIDTTTAGGGSKSWDDSSTIASPRNFLSSSSGGGGAAATDSDTIELSPTRPNMLPDEHQCVCGRAKLRPGEYLGLSERYMASQDVSVTITNPSGEGTTTLSPEKARYYI